MMICAAISSLHDDVMKNGSMTMVIVTWQYAMSDVWWTWGDACFLVDNKGIHILSDYGSILVQLYKLSQPTLQLRCNFLRFVRSVIYYIFPLFLADPLGGVTGRPAFRPPYGNFFLSAGLRICWNKKLRDYNQIHHPRIYMVTHLP